MAKIKSIPKSWEKSALDKKVDKVHGAPEGSKKDNAADRRAMAQKAAGMSDAQILAKAKAKVGGKAPPKNKLMGKMGGK